MYFGYFLNLSFGLDYFYFFIIFIVLAMVLQYLDQLSKHLSSLDRVFEYYGFGCSEC